MSWLLADTGELVATSWLAEGHVVSQPSVGDLDGDGLEDVVAITSLGKLVVFRLERKFKADVRVVLVAMLVALSFLVALVNLSGVLDESSGYGPREGEEEGCRSTESDGGYAYEFEQSRRGADSGDKGPAVAAQRHRYSSLSGDKRAE